MVGAEEHPLATGDRLRSVSRALAVLDALAANPCGQTAKGLAAATGLTLPTVYHLLNTLAAAGYASRDPESKLFTLGPRIPQLHQAYLERARPQPATRPFLLALYQATGRSVFLLRLFGDDAVVIDRIPGPESQAFGAGYVGYSLPAHLTAAGRVLLAFAGASRVQTYMAGRYGYSAGPFPPADANRLEAELTRIRAAGFAADRGESHHDICCLAAPIVLETGQALEVMAIITDRETFLREEAKLRAALLAVSHVAAAVGSTHPGGTLVPEQPLERHLAEAAARVLDLPVQSQES
jgi:IclR family acetate operon transcriptional repressor